MKMNQKDFPETTDFDTPPMHQVEDLTEGGKLAQIVLGNQIYTLRITRMGKLILTK